MRVVDFVIVAAMATGLSGTALAQEGNQSPNSPGQTGTSPSSPTNPPATSPTSPVSPTNPPATSPASPSTPQATSPASPSNPAQSTSTSSSPAFAGGTRSHWTAAGFVGSNFGKSAEDPSVDFGGQIGYLWHGVVGAEILADFAPSFRLTNLEFTNHPTVNAYMANAIGAYPLGSVGQFQPYVSGGIGWINMRTDVLIFNPDLTTGTNTSSQSEFGQNIGAGFLAFMGNNFGFRGDIRYYHANTNNNISTTNVADFLTQSLLSDLKFWRANGGVAFRW